MPDSSSTAFNDIMEGTISWITHFPWENDMVACQAAGSLHVESPPQTGREVNGNSVEPIFWTPSMNIASAL